ncbi:hypothetical protein FTO74_14445 [Granulicella sp. WH15]|uniref:hypothetical protein n=1 Tax=Granulicella sp. WH15 TaxID=2602070 RepID=UPI0013668092|nr:hypothetical protein [Granulicella sp. WH15]QHN04432.1 hypothetical protein FTO74_14445 [Granulicella sp. WH15]
MSNPLPIPAKAVMQANGGSPPVCLLEVLTISNNLYFWSDGSPKVVAVLNTYPLPGSGDGGILTLPPVQFQPWITTPPVFRTYKSTQTATATITIQNVSGDSIRRDAALSFSKDEFSSALIYFRLWREDCELSEFSFQGNVDEIDIDADGDSMTLTVEGFCNWSKITAPNRQIGVSCTLRFGTVNCGSTSAIPCDNSYGTCSSIERFDGIVLEWNGAALDYTQYAQAAPTRVFNGRNPG